MSGHNAVAAPAVGIHSEKPGESRHSASPAAVRGEQIRLLYGTPYVWLFNLVTGLVAAWLLWPVFPPQAVLGWGGLLVVVVALRVAMWLRYQRKAAAAENLDRCALAFTAGTFATGSVWGLLAATVFVTNDPVYYVFVVFVLGGMTAGAVLRDSAYPQAFYAFAMPAILPVIVALLIHGGTTLNAMAAMLTAFTGVLVLMARTNSSRIIDNIRLRIEQDALIDNLEEMGTNLKRHIREREEAATALAESNERIRGISENAQDAIVTADAQGNVVYWNPAAEQTFGYRPDEIVGQPVIQLLARESDRQEVIDNYTEFATTGQAPFVGRNIHVMARRKDGREFPVELSISAMRIGGSWRALGIARDVTERRAAEDALQEREADLREAQRLAHVGSWVRQVHPDVLKWSEELFRIFRLPPSETPPRLDDLSGFVEPGTRERFRGELVACLAAGKPFTIDVDARRADGSKMWISVQGEAVRDADGAITALRGTVQDITERKSAEQDIARLHKQMAENVEALKRRDRSMRAIAQMSDLLQTCHSRSEAFPIIASTAGALFANASGALALAMTGARRMETISGWGPAQGIEHSFAFDDCWALRTGRRYDVPARGHGTLCRHYRTPPAGPSVCLPLSVQGETMGLLHLAFPEGAALDDDQQSLVTTFGDVIKLSLSNLRMREILREQAIHDQLTGLFNRHYLVETLPREILRARRDAVPLSIAMLDIDHFKRLNDTYGHDAGDLVLQRIGSLVRSSTRGGDIACRYGGEEFLLVLPECNQRDAEAFVENLRAEIKRLQITLRDTVLPPLTISAGIAELGGSLQSADALISAADQALYAAKKAGRDRIERFTEAPGAPRA